MSLICPMCGRQTDHLEGGMCPECRLKSTPLATIHPPEPVRVCRGCGAVFDTKWVDVDDIKKLIRKRALECIEVCPEAEGVRIEDSLFEMSSNRYRVEGMIVGAMNTEISQSFVLDMRLAYESCPSCSRLAGGYFEAVVQVRSYSKSPSDAQLERVYHILEALFSALREKGDRLAQLTKGKNVRGGVDLYVGSAKAAKKLCTEAISQLGGTLTTTSTPAGRRDGRAIYRTTYALRLPSFSIGDVVECEGEPCVVVSITNRLHIEPLYRKNTRILPLDSPLEMLGNLKDAQSVPVLDEDATALQVLHPKTFTSVWVKRVEGVRVGGVVDVLVAGDELLSVPREYR